MRRGTGGALLCTAAVLGLLAGCSPAVDVTQNGERLTTDQVKELGEQESSAGHDGQAAVLEDGVVDEREYVDRFEALSACLSAKSITVSNPKVSPVNGATLEFGMDFGSRDMPSSLDDIDACQAEEWSAVSKAFALTIDPVMEAPLRAATTTCLEDKGIEPTGDESNVREFVEILGADEMTVLDCVQVSADQMYVDYPAITVGY